MIPNVKTVSKSGPESTDVYSYRFANKRTVWLIGEIDDVTAAEIVMQIDYLAENGSGDITLYITSPGGSVYAGSAIIDAIRLCPCDVRTVGVGLCASMGAMILACGTKGKRLVYPNAEVIIHQPLGGVQGQTSDIELAASQMSRIKENFMRILAEATGKTVKRVVADCDRNRYLTAAQAVEYGLADNVAGKEVLK